MDVLFL
jgi:hypothetical protein